MMPHTSQEMHTLSGTPDCTPFQEIMISPIHYWQLFIYITELVSLYTVYLDYTDCFASI